MPSFLLVVAPCMIGQELCLTCHCATEDGTKDTSMLRKAAVPSGGTVSSKKYRTFSSLVVFYMDESKYFGTCQLLNKLVIKRLEFWLNLIFQLLLLLYQLVISVLLDTTDKHVREHINKLELMTGKVIVIILYYKNYFIFVIRVMVISSLYEQMLSGHLSESKSSM